MSHHQSSVCAPLHRFLVYWRDEQHSSQIYAFIWFFSDDGAERCLAFCSKISQLETVKAVGYDPHHFHSPSHKGKEVVREGFQMTSTGQLVIDSLTSRRASAALHFSQSLRQHVSQITSSSLTDGQPISLVNQD